MGSFSFYCSAVKASLFCEIMKQMSYYLLQKDKSVTVLSHAKSFLLEFLYLLSCFHHHIDALGPTLLA